MYRERRVLFVVGFLLGDEGITTGLIRLATGLMKYGWEVAIASAMVDNTEKNRDYTRGSKLFESQGIKHFFVPFPHSKLANSKNTLSVLQALLRLNEVVRDFRPDIINVHSLSLCPYAQVIRIFYQIPFVSTARIEPVISRKNVKFTAFINQRFDTFIGDRFIAISTELKEIYEHTLKVPKEKIRLICHGVDNDKFRPPSPDERIQARKAFDIEPEAKVVCLIGRLDPVKGHEILYQAIAILRSKGINLTGICAGTGVKFAEAIKTRAIEIGIADCVRFPGFTDARQVLWASDVLTLPSRREGFAWVIPEAMLCGVVPVRTPSAGAIDQIEDGVDGFIFPFDDPEALALRLRQLLEDDDLRHQLSAAAVESARLKFTADQMIKKTIAVYEEVINA